MRSKPNILVLCGGVLLGLCLAVGFNALADGDPTTDDVPRMIPYQGILEINGEPVHATGDDAFNILFALYDGADAEVPVYVQDIEVEVYGGRFTASIGPTGEGGVSIADVIAAADDLHLGMTLLAGSGNLEEDVALANRQQILATPYSMWSSTASDFDVARDLTVGGDLGVGGTLDVGTVTGLDSISPGNGTLVVEENLNVVNDLGARDIVSRDLNARDVSARDLNVAGTTTLGTVNAGAVSVTNLENCQICIEDSWSEGAIRCIGVNGGWSGFTNDNRLTGSGTPKRIRMDCGSGF